MKILLLFLFFNLNLRSLLSGTYTFIIWTIFDFVQLPFWIHTLLLEMLKNSSNNFPKISYIQYSKTVLTFENPWEYYI